MKFAKQRRPKPARPFGLPPLPLPWGGPPLYILEGHQPVPADVRAWGRWMATTPRHVADEYIGGVRVSTVFLGLDHDFLGGGVPILFESMIFGGVFDERQRRYATWEEAEAGHRAMVAMAEAVEGPPLPGVVEGGE